jgi:hypothetical protein
MQFILSRSGASSNAATATRFFTARASRRSAPLRVARSARAFGASSRGAGPAGHSHARRGRSPPSAPSVFRAPLPRCASQLILSDLHPRHPHHPTITACEGRRERSKRAGRRRCSRRCDARRAEY